MFNIFNILFINLIYNYQIYKCKLFFHFNNNFKKIQVKYFQNHYRLVHNKMQKIPLKLLNIYILLIHAINL